MKPHPILFPFSLIYGLIVSMRNLFFDAGLLKVSDVGVPVISIGNMTAGGTGKTPIVMNAAEILIDAGKKVAIVSRGYGRETTGTIIVCDGSNILADATEAGDEPLMIAMHLKSAVVIVDEDRVRGAKKAVEEFDAEVILLDDGFQHRYIKRQKDIVLIDAERPAFRSMLLPAGDRRELIGSLKRANAVVVTKAKNRSEAQAVLSDDRLRSVQQKFSSAFLPTGIKHIFGGTAQTLEILNGRTAVAFCGIAGPESFRMSLESTGVEIKEFIPFSDHYRFSMHDIESVIASFRRHKADVILTTEKDAVRLQGFRHMLERIPVSSLIMNVSVHQHDEWKNYLLG